MAVILIDTCVVTDLADPDSAWFEWSASTLEQLEPMHTMVINRLNPSQSHVKYSDRQ